MVKYQPRINTDILPIILVGLPGAGKTTVARQLAVALGVQVTDTDAEIRRRARATIPEIFAAEGEQGFRDRETRTLRHVLTSPAAAQGVVALGGGAVLREENRRMLAGRLVIHLAAEPATAAAHVGDGTGRPLMRPAGSSSDDEDLLANPMLARMEELHRARHHLYEEVAAHTVSTDGLSPEQITSQILTLLRKVEPAGAGAASGQVGEAPARTPVAVPIGAPDEHGTVRIRVGGARPYHVVIGHELSAEVVQGVGKAPGGGAGGVAVIHADSVAPVARRYEVALAEAGLRTSVIEVPGGEASKNAETLSRLWEALGRAGIGRDGVVVAVGGGATTDLAGMAAATWLRGIPVVQVPTSLLAMVDAAVGGKTGIDTAAGKNLVGAFHSPASVLCDLGSLETLPQAELRAGLGEVVKCGLMADPVIIERVLAAGEELTRWSGSALAELVARSVAVKAGVVGQDLRESGLREVLNYGHTYAHAIETVTHYQWRHGEAVAVGCLYAAEVARGMGMMDDELVRLHREAFASAGLPLAFPQGQGRWEEMVAVMRRDKKVRAGRIRMVLLDALAHPVRGVEPEDCVLEAAHEAVTRPAS
ncbi:MAG: 3-dehydroquinate synthase [Actinomyces urogenitalis]|uniref:3-dehydroquinate synthase n=1 Tax=Actinomyces urogenitalis TaxID=103621 RepID=UPI002A7F21BA|nr:3-dehydroquinate synthase [Actinomyces urogenitalis]MDY3677775.1 3-dehydroquinate synthase [Actinomyces urogenitalis]